MTIVASNSLTLSNVNDGADAPTIFVKSYTFSAGSRAEIKLTGPNAFKQTVGNRGHNVWVLDVTTHKLKEFVSCDTYTSMSFTYNGVSMTFADYLASLTDSIVVIAASDADRIDQDTRNVLDNMGGSPELGTWGNYRAGHVFIGMSKRSDGTWPLQPRQGYEEAIQKDGSTPEIGCTLSNGGIVVNGATGARGNDGKTPYLHTAYSWSADGKDDFTTVYPNLNLGDNTKTFIGTEDEASKLRGSIRIDPTTKKTQDGDFYYLTAKAPRDNYDWFRFFLIPDTASPNMTKVAVKPNTKYTFSVLLKGTGQHTIYAYQNWTAPNTPWSLQINLTSEWKIYTITVTSSNVIPDRNVQFFIRSNNGTEINLKKPKVEEGSTATPYMPSSSEIKTSDYPNYIGTYSDSNVESSLDYSKYQWAIFKGQNSNAYTAYSWSSDGTDRFSTVYPNLNLSNNTQLNYDDLPTGISNGGGTDKSEKVAINDLAGFSWGRKYTPSTRTAQSGMRVVTDVSKLKIGDTITNSFWIKNTGNRPVKFIPQMGFRYGADTEPNEGVSTGWKYVGGSDIEVKNDGKWTKLTFTTIIPQPTVASNRTGDILKSVVHYAYSSGAMMPLEVTDTFIISPLKLELGSTVTPWMPSESEAQDQWQDAIPMYVGVGEKDSQNPSDYRWQLNPRYVQASSDSGLSNKAGLDDLASVADTANDALVQAQNAVSNEDYTSWLEHDYQTTINNLQDVSTQNKEDINNVDNRTTIVEGFYDEMKVKWNFIDESFTFSEEGMFISNVQSQMAIQVTSDKIVFWDNNVDVAFITGEVLNIQKGVFLESATIGNHLITKFSDESPVTIIRYVGGIT
ncbi:tail protein [Lactococcus phage AM4]|uniref:Tail protein n=2 Tax=Audreyjarvisvirus AM4 TaxID=2845189 RepID=A0A1W6JKN2_9CAUD|nr:host range and adsorption protein [Lactococcus phage AM4]ARM66773.1 tail protein [Lactococcus phage AM4]ARM67006.1 tail protein [Lactococcus phage AM5]